MPNPENIEGHQFKEGESGNPDGRPVGSKSFKTILNRLLDLAVTEEELEDADIKRVFADCKDKPTNREFLLAKMLLEAKRNPDGKSAQRVLERVEGKAVQHIEQKIDDLTPKINVAVDGKFIDLSK